MENLKIIGKFKIENSSSGEVREVYNTIHNAGLATITGLLGSGLTGSQFNHIALGTGSSTINSSNTTLGAETLRISGIVSQATTSVTNDTLKLIGSFVGDTTETINEAAVFNRSGVNLGSMLSRVVFAGVPVVNLDNINVTYTIAFA